MAIARRFDIACLIEDDAELAAALEADGVAVAADMAAYRAARARLGEAAIVGVHCPASRHVAMELGEAGADYVGFAGDDGMLAWWSELFTVPSVALDAVAGERARAVIATGADFIRPDDGMWTAPGRARKTIAALSRIIDAQDGEG